MMWDLLTQMMGQFPITSDRLHLYQYQGPAFYIVGYNSKKLPKAVQNYSVTELGTLWVSG